MSTVMIVAVILMIARLSLRIGFVLVLIWGVIRLIDRWRLPTTAPVAAAAAHPVAVSNIDAPAGTTPDTKEEKE
jgi:hypothetical protein